MNISQHAQHTLQTFPSKRKLYSLAQIEYLSCASLPGLMFDTWEIACLCPSKPVLKARVLPTGLLQVNLDYQEIKKLQNNLKINCLS